MRTEIFSYGIVNLLRGVRIESRCVMCNRAGEDGGGHLFFKCKQVKAVWRSAGFEKLRERLVSVSGCKGDSQNNPVDRWRGPAEGDVSDK